MIAQKKSAITSIKLLTFRSFQLTALFAAMIWPAIYNSGPYYYPDTASYIERGDLAIAKLTCITTRLFRGNRAPCAKDNNLTSPELNGTSSSTLSPNSSPQEKKQISVRGRSKYYGVLLSLGKTGGQFWISLLLQAIALVVAIAFLLRALNKPIWPTLLLIGFLICVFSDAAFFVSFLVPDVFVGITILTIAEILALERKLRFGEAVTAFVLVFLGPLFHDSAILIAFLLICVALVWNLLRRFRPIWINYGVLALALVSAIVGQSVVLLRAKYMLGETPVRIPFLSARLIADGPGTDFLRDTCPENGFILCRFVHRFPIPSDTFLWQSPDEGGVWAPSSEDNEELASLKQRVSDEDLRFAIAVFKHDPISTLKHAFLNGARQLIYFPLNEFRYDTAEKAGLNRNLPISSLPGLYRSAAYKGKVPVFMFSLLDLRFCHTCSSLHCPETFGPCVRGLYGSENLEAFHMDSHWHCFECDNLWVHLRRFLPV